MIKILIQITSVVNGSTSNTHVRYIKSRIVIIIFAIIILKSRSPSVLGIL